MTLLELWPAFEENAPSSGGESNCTRGVKMVPFNETEMKYRESISGLLVIKHKQDMEEGSAPIPHWTWSFMQPQNHLS